MDQPVNGLMNPSALVLTFFHIVPNVYILEESKTCT